MSDEIKKILIVDANNTFFRAYCASPTLNENGQHVGGITGFLYSLQKAIKDVRPHQVYIIWDGRGGSKKRKEINKDYKDGRKVPAPLRMNRAHDIQSDPEEELKSCYYQQSRVIQYLTNFPFIQLCEDGVEADDFISYMCSKLSCQENYLKVIISNDKDFAQLIDNCTILYRPAEKAYITINKWLEKEKVHPKNMALSRAIEGDNSDNLDGVKGVGRKTIAKVFKEFTEDKFITLDDLKVMCESSGKEPAKKILKDFEIVTQNYKIMQLYMPMVNFQAANKIDEQIKDFKPEISFMKFIADCKEDGIIGSSFRDLRSHSEKMIKDWGSKNEK